MFTLDRVERTVLGSIALAATLAALAVAPTRAGNAPPPVQTAADARPVRTAPTDLAVARDPFGPETDAATPPPAQPTLPPLQPLPPNAGAGAFPFGAPRAGARLFAIVDGPLPRALVEDAGRSRVIAAGDRFAGARVTAIDADGVVLDDGRRFTIDPEHRP